MKNKILLALLVAGLVACSACSASAPANANANANKTTNTTTNTTGTGSNANANTSTASNTNSTSNSGSTAQEGKQDFTLVNQTGVEIDKLYISPHNADEWQEDILGQDTLPTGQSVDIKFHRSEKAALWDLRIEDSKGNAIEWENLNLLEISKVTLFYKDGKGTAQVE